MAYVGSDILEVTYNHPVIGQGTFQCKAGEGVTIDLGGVRSGDDRQNVTGGGKRINVQTMNCSQFTLTPVAWDKTGKDELKQLNKLVADPIGAVWTVAFLDGNVYRMQNGTPVGDIAGEGYNATIPLTLQGDAYPATDKIS